MDALTILAAVTTAAAVFIASLGLQRTVGQTRRSVEQRIQPRSTGGAGIQLTLPRLGIAAGGKSSVDTLEQAGLALTRPEFTIIRLASGLVLAAIVALGVSSLDGAHILLTIILAALTFLIGQHLPKMWVNGRLIRRLHRAEDQLLTAMDSMVKSLRAGVGLTQALEYAAHEIDEPLGPELRRAVRELQLGADIEVVMAGLTRRVGSTDLEIASTAMIVQRRVGGNLSEILSNVTATIRERRAIRAEVRSITSQQRLSGNLAAVLPIFIVMFFFVVNPDSAQYLFTKTIGLVALTAGLLFELFGLWLIRRFANVEY